MKRLNSWKIFLRQNTVGWNGGKGGVSFLYKKELEENEKKGRGRRRKKEEKYR
jgi:hypothetical protein